MPDDVAKEKSDLLYKLGAKVEKVRPASIVDKNQFVNLAKTRALEYTSQSSDVNCRGFFADQFERQSNWKAHYNGTAKEIWSQCNNGSFDAFVSGSGTGGTISGCACYFKEKNPDIKIVLADPHGSGLYNKVKYGVMYANTEKEGTRRRHQVDTIVEGIGINRLTQNFNKGYELIDEAFRVTDEEAIAMSRFIMKSDGLFLGSSSCCNLVASVKLSKILPKNSRIVTILCDNGSRHLSRFWNDDLLKSLNLNINDDINFLLT